MLILYIILIISSIVWNQFTRSFEKLHYYSTYLIDYHWGIENLNIKKFFKYNTNKSLNFLKCCVLSSIIYSNSINFKSMTYFDKVYELYGYSFSRNRQIKGFVAKCKNFFIVSIIATSNLDDILVSSNTKKIETDYGDFHEGYYQQAVELLSDIYKILTKHSSINHIYLCGHSFGGTIASILSFLISKNGKYKICCYNFGSVKYGDNTLKYHIENKNNLKIFNIINTADLVVYKPLINNYTRIGENIKYRVDTGNDILNHSIKVYRKCLIGPSVKIENRANRFYENIFHSVLNCI